MSVLAYRPKRLGLPALLIIAAIVVASVNYLAPLLKQEPGKAKRITAGPLASVISAPVPSGVVAPPAPPAGFSTQTRLGFFNGDQWEPAIAADRFGHVYMLYAQYYGVPGCEECGNPTQILQISNDHGATWGAPTPIYLDGPNTGQWDSQIVVDPVDGSTVYAVWMEASKSDIAVAKSTDFGVTWSVVIADTTNAAVDKPILAVRGQDVYVSYTHTQKLYVASSHDGGQTFTQTEIKFKGKLGWAMAGGGYVAPNGTAYMAWAGYEQNGGAKGPVNLVISSSTNGGTTWTNKVVDVSRAPEKCPADYLCGWAYLGAQIVMAGDDAGNVYALSNANNTDFGPSRIYFYKSTNNGATWSSRVEVSTAGANISHNFPAIAATGNGDVRITWMDERTNGWWNTYYRSSTNGGATWTAEQDVSAFVEGYSTYITADGFRFPFGDYFEMDIDENGTNHIIMGEGYSYDSPGSIWYTQGE
jgi:hypothetical protein